MLWMAGLGCAGMLALGCPASAQAPVCVAPGVASAGLAAGALGGRRVTLDVVQQEVREVLGWLARQSGVNVAVAPEVSGRVTLYLRDVSASEAFEAVITASGLRWERAGSVILVRRR